MTDTPLYDAMLPLIDPDAIFAEVDAIADEHERLAAYAIIAKNTEPERQVTDIRLRAERNHRRLHRQVAKARELLGI